MTLPVSKLIFFLQQLSKLEGDSNSIRSNHSVIVLDSKTIKIPALTYDGKGGDIYFYAGEGPQPSSRGFIVPDELGYLAPLGAYKAKDVILQLPGRGFYAIIYSMFTIVVSDIRLTFLGRIEPFSDQRWQIDNHEPVAGGNKRDTESVVCFSLYLLSPRDLLNIRFQSDFRKKND